MYLVVLLLEYGKYFLDVTSQNHFSVSDFDLRKYEWTTVYKPLKIIEFIPGCQLVDVKNHFLYYVKRFGIEHVRCCQYGTFDLSDKDRIHIQNQLQRHDLEGDKYCYLCRISDSHYTKDCITLQTRCYSCGQFGHEVDQCHKVHRIQSGQRYAILDEEENGGSCCQKCCYLFC